MPSPPKPSPAQTWAKTLSRCRHSGAVASTASGRHTAPPKPRLPTVVRLMCSYATALVGAGGREGREGGGGGGGDAAGASPGEALVSLVALAVMLATASAGAGAAGGAGGSSDGWKAAVPSSVRGVGAPSASCTHASSVRAGCGASAAEAAPPYHMLPLSSSAPSAVRLSNA